MSRALAFVAAGALLLASPASAQYVSPGAYGQPVYSQPAYPPDMALWKNTVRLSAGVAFVGAGYYCSYYGYYPGYGSCGYGYSETQPNINLEVDLGLKGPSAISFGGNVFWGSYKAISTTVWE